MERVNGMGRLEMDEQGAIHRRVEKVAQSLRRKERDLTQVVTLDLAARGGCVALLCRFQGKLWFGHAFGV